MGGQRDGRSNKQSRQLPLGCIQSGTHIWMRCQLLLGHSPHTNTHTRPHTHTHTNTHPHTCSEPRRFDDSHFVLGSPPTSTFGDPPARPQSPSPNTSAPTPFTRLQALKPPTSSPPQMDIPMPAPFTPSSRKHAHDTASVYRLHKSLPPQDEQLRTIWQG